LKQWVPLFCEEGSVGANIFKKLKIHGCQTALFKNYVGASKAPMALMLTQALTIALQNGVNAFSNLHFNFN
jgi:hypothetical protein